MANPGEMRSSACPFARREDGGIEFRMIIDELIFQIAKRKVAAAPVTTDVKTQSRESLANYHCWRKEELQDAFLENFSPSIIEDKDVLDFGCGLGPLSF